VVRGVRRVRGEGDLLGLDEPGRGDVGQADLLVRLRGE
jgi:hypothetical protein